MILLKNIGTGACCSISDKKYKSLIRRYGLDSVHLEKGGIFEFRNILKLLEKVQEHDDILMLGRTMTIKHAGFGLGCDTIYQRGLRHANFDMTQLVELEGGLICHFDEQGHPVIPDLSEIATANIRNMEEYRGRGTFAIENSRIACAYYPEGFVLYSGSIDRYFRRFSSTNAKVFHIDKARVFSSLSELRTYVKNNSEKFNGLLKTSSVKFSVVPACSEYEHDMELLPRDSNAVKKHEVLVDEIRRLLDYPLPDFTHCGIPEYIMELAEWERNKKGEKPYELTDDDLKNEAIRRINHFCLTGVRILLEKDQIVMSYSDSFLCKEVSSSGDAAAAHAIDECRAGGFYPYHVIRTPSPYGMLYYVLFISKYASEWDAEFPNEFGFLDAFLYNADGDFSDIGRIKVKADGIGIRFVGKF